MRHRCIRQSDITLATVRDGRNEGAPRREDH